MSGSHAAVRVPLSGWSWANPAPQGNDLRAIDFRGARGYAVGAAGTALRTDDGGSTWTGLATGTGADLRRLQIIDPDRIVVLGGDGCVLRRSDDGGATFRKIFVVAEVGCPDRIQAAHFVDKDVGYLLLADGSVLRTADGGTSFSKQTAIPGTQASATPQGATARDILFTGPDGGIAFATPAGGASSVAYYTTDAGVSWKALELPGGSVERLYRFDATTIYALGQDTLLRSTDGGATFTRQAFGAGAMLTSIGCADPQTCLLTTSRGELHRTTDGGATTTAITASSRPLAGAAFASPARAVAVGAAGGTVVSDDAGINYIPLGGDLGVEFARLRPGPTAMSAFAIGSKGRLAFTFDGGASWKVADVPTSAQLVDTSWSSATTGYALDIRGGLFRTTTAGVSWETLSAGAGPPAAALLAVPGGTSVLLFGPLGMKRSVDGGPFAPIATPVVARAQLFDARLAGSTISAWGRTRVLLSPNDGRSWRSVALPAKTTRIREVSFQGASTGFLLDVNRRLWLTRNGGRSWSEAHSTGTSSVATMSFGSATSGYLGVGRFGDDRETAYVLRTTDGGRSWRPQAIAGGRVASIVATAPARAFALAGTPFSLVTPHLFFTTAGGDAGAASTLKIGARPARFTKKALRAARGRVTIDGTLGGAIGGERITISARPLNGTRWTSRTVTAGANGGSFSTTLRIAGTTAIVAQWAGDSGRVGGGTRPLVVRVAGSA